MDQYLALSQAVAEWLDFVGGSKRKIVIRERDACFCTLAQLTYEIADVQAGANVEERLIEGKIKLKDLAPWPGCKIYITGHTEAFYPDLSEL